jgi:UDP-N-acetylglucosamine/UDP-N-acetylgalactosamine 4-epimerase
MVESAYHTGSLERYAFLVTGGAGFIGSHIVEYLLRHNAGKVRVIDNLSGGSPDNVKLFSGNPTYEFLQADICDYPSCSDACNGMDFVFHNAAMGSVPRSIQDPLATHRSNATGFLNMLVAAKEQAIRRFVYASSSSVFGDSAALPKSEEQLGNPLSPYAVTKRTDEMYAQVFAKTYGMDIVGLRYFNIFGPRQDPNGPYAAAIPLFIHALLDGRPNHIFGNGEQSRDFTFVSNAVQANILAMLSPEREMAGEIFNIAAGRQTTVNELCNMLGTLAGCQSEIKHLPERAGDILHSYADISKAKKFLGYEPAVQLEQGLRITLDWFRQMRANP